MLKPSLAWSQFNHSIYPSQQIILIVYVDGIVLTVGDSTGINQLKHFL